MNYVEQMQTLSKEAATKTIFDALNSKAFDAISEITVSNTVIAEGVRKVGDYTAGRHSASIHKDSDLGEYKVKFYKDGKHHEPADYFTDSKEDASGTAKNQCDQQHAKDTA